MWFYFTGDTIKITTPDEYKYESLSIRTTHRNFVFRVRTCMDAHIKLLPDEVSGIDDYYEIVLGGYGNTQSDIRKPLSGGVQASAQTLNILNCEQFRVFWISWSPEDKTIRVGSGIIPGMFEIMFYTDVSYIQVDTVEISTWEHYGGEWEIEQRTGRPFGYFCSDESTTRQ